MEDYRLSSHAGSGIQALYSKHPKRVIKGRESIMALFGINRPTRSSWVRAREVGYQDFQVVEWRSDTRSYGEDFNNSQWEFMSH